MHADMHAHAQMQIQSYKHTRAHTHTGRHTKTSYWGTNVHDRLLHTLTLRQTLAHFTPLASQVTEGGGEGGEKLLVYESLAMHGTDNHRATYQTVTT